MDRTFGDWFSNPEVITWTKDWGQTLALLKDAVKANARVAVVPNATMQYYDDF
jgi:hypothetical protein